MIFNIAILIALAILGFAVFYLVIRMKDISQGISKMGDKLPLTDEMRRQASSTIESLNERMGSLNQKAQQISDVMNELTGLN